MGRFISEGTIYTTRMSARMLLDKTERVGITIPGSILKRVDKVRGDIPRSTFIRRAIQESLKGGK
jgi:hypothetical protein